MLTVQPEEDLSAADLERVVPGVRDFDRAVGGHGAPRPVVCLLRDGSGEVLGGVQGNLRSRSVHIAAH